MAYIKGKYTEPQHFEMPLSENLFKKTGYKWYINGNCQVVINDLDKTVTISFTPNLPDKEKG